MELRQVVCVLTMTVLSFAATADPVIDEVKERYFLSLDKWVADGGNVETIQMSVVENCGKLVMASASMSEKAAFVSTAQEEFHFRVDVCAKMTVNRVHPQPEFKKKEIVKLICDEGNELFVTLCHRSGLR